MKTNKTGVTLVIFILLSLLGFLHVFVRMRNMDKQIAINKLKGEIDIIDLTNKELKAKRASLLSTEKLKEYASKYGLREPSSSQVVILKE